MIFLLCLVSIAEAATTQQPATTLPATTAGDTTAQAQTTAPDLPPTAPPVVPNQDRTTIGETG